MWLLNCYTIRYSEYEILQHQREELEMQNKRMVERISKLQFIYKGNCIFAIKRLIQSKLNSTIHSSVAQHRRTTKLQNAIGVIGQKIKQISSQVGLIVTKYRERRDGLMQLATSIQYEIGQVRTAKHSFSLTTGHYNWMAEFGKLNTTLFLVRLVVVMVSCQANKYQLKWVNLSFNWTNYQFIKFQLNKCILNIKSTEQITMWTHCPCSNLWVHSITWPCGLD